MVRKRSRGYSVAYLTARGSDRYKSFKTIKGARGFAKRKGGLAYDIMKN